MRGMKGIRSDQDSPVRRLRTHLDLSQAAFGASIGVPQHTVSQWESGTDISGPLAARIFSKWSRQFKRAGVSQVELLSGENAG